MHYKPIQHIEALPKIFSSSWEYGGITVERDDINDPRDHNMPLPMFIAMDPPQHTAQRRTVAPAFGPAEIERMRADAVTRTSAVLDTLPIGTPFDWVKSVSTELTTQMLAILFDFPWEERNKLNEWSDMAGDIEIGATSEGRLLRAMRAQALSGPSCSFGTKRRKTPAART